MTTKEIEETQENKTVPERAWTFSSLPDEITENILARVSRCNYPSLSLVSKRFHNLLSSMEIYKTRSQIGAEETCVCILLELPDHRCASWFRLWTKPNNQNVQPKRNDDKNWFKRDSSSFSVVTIPNCSSTDSYPDDLRHIKTVGPEIYIVCGSSSNKKPSSSVRIFDCRSHTWHDAPNMTVARKKAHLVLLDEKLYVMGGCNIAKYYANWIEVFDIKSQSWSALPAHGADDYELRNHLRQNSDFSFIVNVFQGKFYVAGVDKDYTYEPKTGTWKLVRDSPFLSDSIEVLCEMENVLYCCTNSGCLMWSSSFDFEGREWIKIKGLEKLCEHPTRGLRTGYRFQLVGYGGQLLVMWDPFLRYRIKRNNQIWYAKISLESRCNGREMWGNVECVDVVTFPVVSFESFHCVAASV